jgi:hypothetical protein
LALRLRVYVIRRRLDREIALRASSPSNEALALRAGQLTQRRTRQRIAGNLRRIVAYVDRVGSRRDFSAVVTDRAAVTAGRQSILGLAERFEGSDPVNPRGVVLAGRLLTDGFHSPLFNSSCGQTVTEAVWEVADALGEQDPTMGFDAIAL